jgi:DNA invertase Pin-like site-specific DNA recombinase
MPTSVSIISVDLDPDAIITEEIRELTAQNQEQLGQFQEVQAAVASLKEKKKQAKENPPELQKTIEIHDALVATGASGMLASAIAEMAGCQLSTFALRIKSYLKTQGNQWALTKVKKGKNDFYVLIPFNQE